MKASIGFYTSNLLRFSLLNSRVSKNEVKSQEPFIYFSHLDLLNNAIL